MRRLVVVLLLGLFAWPASASAGSRVRSVHYEGSYSYRSSGVGPNGSVTQRRTLSWVMTLYDDGRGDVSKHFSAQGSESTIYGDGSGDSCTISQRTNSINGPFTLATGDGSLLVDVATFVPSDVDPAGNLTVAGGTCSGLAGNHGVLFPTPNPDGSDSTGNPCWGFERAKQFVNPRIDRNLRLDTTRKIDLEQVARHVPSCQTNTNFIAIRAIHATLRVGAGGAAQADRNGPTAAEIQKTFATADLLTALLRAQLPCAWTGLGVGTALWAATVGGATAPAALVPANVLISAGSQLCLTYAVRIANDVKIANDPPVGNLNAIAKPKPTRSGPEAAATLAGCANAPADQQAFCASLRAAAGEEIAAGEKLASIATALQTTVDRESKARKQHNQKALKRQEKAGRGLLKQLKAAALNEDQTWRTISQLLGAQGLTGQLSPAQDAAGIDNLLARLKAQGVSAAMVKRLDSSALVPKPVDLIAS